MQDATLTETDKLSEQMKGAFWLSLRRSNKEIKSSRALAIAEQLKMFYRRKVEDLDREIKTMKLDRENMLDLSPENTTSLKLASEFKPEEFTKTHIELGVKIRQHQIALDVARDGYEYLFGEKVAL